MKKAFTLAVYMLLMIPAFAQLSTFGVQAGYQGYTIHGRYADGSNFWLRPEEGFNLGVNFEFPIARNVYLQPGIQYNQKGANFDDYQYMGTTYKGDVKLAYVEVPVNFLFKPRVGRGRLIVGGGPYLGRGLGREAGIDPTIYHVRFDEDVTTQQVNSMPFYFRPWDAGANIVAGYQFPRNLYVQLNGQVGMKRINPSVDGRWEGKNKHRNIGAGLSFGYRF